MKTNFIKTIIPLLFFFGLVGFVCADRPFQECLCHVASGCPTACASNYVSAYSSSWTWGVGYSFTQTGTTLVVQDSVSVGTCINIWDYYNSSEINYVFVADALGHTNKCVICQATNAAGWTNYCLATTTETGAINYSSTDLVPLLATYSLSCSPNAITNFLSGYQQASVNDFYFNAPPAGSIVYVAVSMSCPSCSAPAGTHVHYIVPGLDFFLDLTNVTQYGVVYSTNLVQILSRQNGGGTNTYSITGTFYHVP